MFTLTGHQYKAMAALFKVEKKSRISNIISFYHGHMIVTDSIFMFDYTDRRLMEFCGDREFTHVIDAKGVKVSDTVAFTDDNRYAVMEKGCLKPTELMMKPNRNAPNYGKPSLELIEQIWSYPISNGTVSRYNVKYIELLHSLFDTFAYGIMDFAVRQKKDNTPGILTFESIDLKTFNDKTRCLLMGMRM